MDQVGSLATDFSARPSSSGARLGERHSDLPGNGGALFGPLSRLLRVPPGQQRRAVERDDPV